MRLAVFAKTFRRPTLDRVCEAVRNHGFYEIHLNLSCAGLECLPETLSIQKCRSIARTIAKHGLELCSLSGTFNAIHPNIATRNELIRRACRLIECCHDLGARMVSLCTGTRCADDNWTWHAANDEPEAWNDLCRTLDILLATATQHDVLLCIEPEHGNIINSAVRARRLCDELQTPHLKLVIDGANLVNASELGSMHCVFDEAFALLGQNIVMAHAKELPRHPEGSQVSGSGLLDWDCYLRGLANIGFSGPLLLHGMDEIEVAESLRFLESRGCYRLASVVASSREGAAK